MIRLSSYYGSRLRKGLIDPACPMTVLRESPTTLSVDAGNGLGHPVSVKTMQQVITKAEFSGLGVRAESYFPGAENLRGTIDLTERGGAVHIDARAASLFLPAVFPGASRTSSEACLAVE